LGLGISDGVWFISSV